jgi:hypothetical protein
VFLRRPGNISKLSGRLLGGRQRNGGFAGEDPKNKRLLKIQLHGGIGVAEIPDRNILSDFELKVAASWRRNKGSFNGRCPDQVTVDNALHVLEYGISMIAGFGESGIFAGPNKTE